jgi:cytochrome c-type biogenesis protein
MRRLNTAIVVVAWSSQSTLLDGFSVSTRPTSRHKSSVVAKKNFHPTSRPTVLNAAVNWDELLYSAQAAGSDLASLSLQDPSNLLTSMPIMYGAGLLTSFSPCVWGLLPLTMSYISQAAGEREDRQAALPTLAFAAGLAAVFCSLGVAVATLGGVFGGTSGTTGGVILPLMSNGICLAMGLQLLGFVQLSLPSFLSLSPDDNNSNNNNVNGEEELILLDGSGRIVTSSKEQSKKKEASLFRTFLLGGSSALVASPCATPVLTSILAFVASAQNGGLGALLLLGYTLGYSTPLLLVASTGGQALVELRQNKGGGTSIYGKIAPWVTPLTGGVLLWYGTNGLLVALFGDPSLAGLAPILE